jgi:ribosomal protein L44E
MADSAPTGDPSPVVQTSLPAQVTATNIRYFTEDEVEKFRADERSKLQQELERTKAQQAQTAADLKKLTDAQAEKDQAEADRIKAEQDAARVAAEADMDAKSILENRTQDWETRFTSLQEEMRQKDAAHILERQALELQGYIQSRVAQELGEKNIAPQLAKFVDGTSVEEVEASIANVKQTTAEIAQELAAEQEQARRDTPGISTHQGPSSMGSVPELTEEIDYTQLSMKDYLEKVRPKLGIGQGGQGLFS